MKRTALWLGLVGVVTLAMSLSATASLYDYEGPVQFKLTSWDMGMIYTSQVSTGGVYGIDNVNKLSAIEFAGAGANGDVFYDSNGYSTLDGDMFNESLREDGWGIFRITEIRAMDSSSTILWSDGQGGVELMGIFYGMVDNVVIASGSPKASEIFIQSQNIRYAIYENDWGTFASAETNGLTGAGQGSFGRTGFSEYNGITDGRLLLEGYSVRGQQDGFYGQDGVEMEHAQFLSWFTPNADLTSGSGGYQTRINLTGGDWYAYYKTDHMDGDFQIQGTTADNSGADKLVNPVGNWTVQDNDPMRGRYSVPEPMTMSLLALGGLALLRRRK